MLVQCSETIGKICQTISKPPLYGAIALAIVYAAPAFSQPAPGPVAEVASFSDLADLAFAAPIAAQVRIAKTWRLRDEEAVGVPEGHTRFLIEANVERLLSGRNGLPGTIRYIADVPNTAAGRPAKLKDATAFVFLTGDVSRPDQMRLISRNAQIAANPRTEATLRSLLQDAATPAGTTRITGIANAFHIPGAVPGESESQIFLSTADRRPVSLSVLRRPGETPRWSVALGEFVDDAAGPPERDTLLWYRLACSLPPSLPSGVLSDLSVSAALAVSADYRLVLERLGPCGRTTEAGAASAAP
jgi:hypothetical protein